MRTDAHAGCALTKPVSNLPRDHSFSVIQQRNRQTGLAASHQPTRASTQPRKSPAKAGLIENAKAP